MKAPNGPGYKPGDKVFSNKLFVGYIEFMDKKLGKVMTDQVPARINLDRLTLSDLNAYTSDEVSHAITMAAIELTGEKKLSYLVGRNLPNSIGRVAGFIAGVTSPAFFMKGAGEIEGRLALKTINKTTQIGKNRFKVEITYKDGFMARDYICDNRIGCFESVPLFFGLPYAKVEHPQCVHRNEGNCIYFVQFPDSHFLVYKRIAQGLFLASLAAAGFAFSVRTGPGFNLAPMALVPGAFAFYSLYKHQSAKKSLEWSLLNNESMVKQNLLLDALNTKLTSLQKLTAKLVESPDAGEACGIAVQGLIREMRFGSSQVWLLDEDGEYIRCEKAEGYSGEIRPIIMNARFKYKDNWNNPHGLLVQTMLQGKTVIANDMQEVLPRLTEQAREFLSALKLSSFIMTPLIHDGKPLGILAGEHHNGEKIEIHDQMIFQSLSLVLTGVLRRASNAPSFAGAPTIDHAAIPRNTPPDFPGQVAENIADALESPLHSLKTLMSGFQKCRDALGKFRSAAYREAKDPDALDSLKKIDKDSGMDAVLAGNQNAAAALERCETVVRHLRLLADSLAPSTTERVQVGPLVLKSVQSLSKAELGSMEVDIRVPQGLAASAAEAGLLFACKALISNAAEAMDGKGRLEITGTEDNGAIKLAFRDRGPGISPAFKSRIFQPFFTTKPPGQGTGVGLAIARNELRKSGGDLTVESVPGQGSLFLLTLKHA